MNSIDYHLKELEIAVAADDPRTVNPEMPEGVATVLDLGCGIGQGLLVSRLKPEVFACGVDIDDVAVCYAKRLAPVHHFVCAVAERLPLSDRSFDCVVSRVTLPFLHIPAALREIARVTKDGGHVWFTLHSWSMARKALFKAIRQHSLKNTLFRIYVIANGICFHLIGKQFRYPLRRRWCESFQTVRGMTRAMRQVGFGQVAVQRGQFFVLTAVKVSTKEESHLQPSRSVQSHQGRDATQFLDEAQSGGEAREGIAAGL
jgi:ubiquinone/menaquinone biosynthesis C-methylase UbiE